MRISYSHRWEPRFNGKLHFCAVIIKEWVECKEKLLPLVQWNEKAPVREGLQFFSSNKHSTLQISSNQPQTAYYTECLQ